LTYCSKGSVWEAPKKNETDSTEIHFSRPVADTLPYCKGEFRIFSSKIKEDKLIASTDSIYAQDIDDRFL